MRVAVLLVASALAVGAEQPTSPAQADALHQKLLQVVQHGSQAAPPARQTIATEAEVNSYLKYRVTSSLPTGVSDPAVTLVGSRRVSGKAIVDLDVIRQKQSQGGWLDPMAYLTGKLPVTASGVLTTANGVGRFELEAADISGVPVPASLIQQIVGYYTRSADQPSGVTFAEPFDLPARIQRIEIEAGRAVIVQ